MVLALSGPYDFAGAFEGDDAGREPGPPDQAGVAPPGPEPRTRFWERAPLTGPLVTDRPDFTESTDAVPYGHFQLEMGYTFTYDREQTDRVHSHTAPEGLLRLGMLENFELRIGWDGYQWSENLFETQTRAGRSVRREEWTQDSIDMSLGLKYKFLEQDGLLPHFGVIAEVSVPSGSGEASSGDVDPTVVLLWAYDLADGLSVAGNVGLGVPTDPEERFFQTTGSLSFAVALTDRLGAYVEYFGFYPNTARSDCAHSFNGGFTYLITENFQVDIRAGMGLNEEADDFFTGAGFAWRY